MTYWRGTFVARATATRPKITKVYTIAIPRAQIDAAQDIATREVTPFFQKQSGEPAAKPAGAFIRVTHPERLHDRLSPGGHPVWLETRSRY